jgi:xylan 1,4-beta-xylosidase
LQNADESYYVCTDTHGEAQVLIWDITHPTGGRVSDQDYFFHPHPAREKGSVAVRLKNLAPGNYHLKIGQTGSGQNDPYSRYLEMGSPSDLSREAVAELKNLSSGKPVSEKTVAVAAGGNFEIVLPLHENDVYFLVLVPK